MACHTCGEPVWIKTTASGKLAYRCEACSCSAFAEPGDRAHRIWSKTMAPYTDPDAEPAAPAPAPAPAARQAPAPAPEPAGFSLGRL